MREIMFRAKQHNDNNWIYSKTIANGTIKRKKDYLYLQSGSKWFRSQAETLGEFTGVEDWFENDLIAFPYITPMGEIGDKSGEYSYYGKIIFKNGKFVMKPVKSDSGFWEEQELSSLLKQKAYIIGNIHDNPELLK